MRTILLTPVLLSLLALGCAQEGLPSEGERIESDESAIINGSPDVTHTAVVAVLGPDFECTGTVLQVKGTTGYVLTAAHCCPANDLPIQVVIGANYNTGVSHEVVTGSVVSDPCYQDYAGSTDDVCMLKFKNAAGVPIIPPMTPQTDNLATGTSITYVGYGLTAAPPNGNNSLRRFVTKTVGNLDPYFVEYANGNVSGTCEGDSGGPGIVVVNGQEQVASVTSFGDQNCSQLGSSIRTSAVYDGFIAPYLADQAANPTCPVVTDCNACSSGATQNGKCSNLTKACIQDAQCSALVQCYQGCTTTACVNTCNTQHTGGLTKYVAIESCICNDACAAACSASTTCTAPKCGLKSTDTAAACTSCVETTCCAEAWDCQADTTCRKCFGTNPPAACATNANAAAYYACAESKCGCAIDDPGGNGTTTAASTAAATTGGGETTTTTAGAGGGATATVGAGGSAATTAGAGGAGGSSSSSSSGDVQVGGCSCSTTDSGRTPAAPFAALALGVFGMVARRRRGR